MTRRFRRLCWLSAVSAALCGAAIFLACMRHPTDKIDTDNPASDLPTVPEGPAFYIDVTEPSGVKFTYRNGEAAGYYAILDSLGGGGALIDFDGDGLLDLYIPGGGALEPGISAYYPREVKKRQEEKNKNPNANLPPLPATPKITGHAGRLYRNLGNFRFEDVTDKVIGAQPDFYSHGCAVCDYDRDGWPDLLVTGYGRVVLYHNEPDGKGGRKFVDVTEKTGLLGPNPRQKSAESGQPGDHFWSTSAAWADLDGDGFPDLYLCQYVNWSFAKFHPWCPGYISEKKMPDGKVMKIDHDVCPPREFQSVPHAVWRNNGNGTFTNVTKECGLRVEREDKDYGKGLGVLIMDVDGDGKPDIYVCNDTTDNFLYMNKSTPGKIRFEERGLAMGVARDHNGTPNGSMGVDGADYNGTGRPSIWVTNYESEYNALYSALPGPRLSFTFNTPAAGLSVLGPSFVGFGTKFVDVDNDGWEDIVISNGHVVHVPPRDNLLQKPILFMNMPFNPKSGPTRRFADGTARGASYFSVGHRGRGLAVGDLNNTGHIDLVFTPVNEPVAILKNVAGENNNWLGVELRRKDNRDAVGTRLTLDVGDRKLVRYVKGGGSYMSACDQRIVFGLGTAKKVGKLSVDWSWGGSQTWENLEPGKYHKLQEK